MISYILSLLSCFLSSEWLNFWFFPLFALGFLVTVPRIIRTFLER